jgi:A/G-specific adenine glycosylase
MLGGMTELPGSDWTDAPTDPGLPFEADWQRAGQVGHTFTHFHLELIVWQASVPLEFPAGDGWWVAPADLAAAGLPTLFKKALREAGIEER